MPNRLDIDPARLQRALERELSPVSEGMGNVVTAFLREKLSGPGSGIHHPGLPNPSSAPGEYPAEQSGDLVNCIGHEPDGPFRQRAGALNSVAPVPPWAYELEYPSPPGTPSPRNSSHGARPWLSKALGDEELHDRLRGVARERGLEVK